MNFYSKWFYAIGRVLLVWACIGFGLYFGLLEAQDDVPDQVPYSVDELFSPAAKNAIIARGEYSHPPFQFLDDTGKPQGFSVDLIQALAREMDLDVSLSLGPWETVRQEINNQEIDLVLGMFYSKERSRRVDFTIPYFIISYGVFAPRNSGIQTIQDIQDKRILVQKEDYGHDYVREHHLGQEIIPEIDIPSVFRALNEGEGDCAFVAQIQGMHLLDQMALPRIQYIASTGIQRHYCFAVKKGDQALKTILEAGMTYLRKDGTFDELYKKWFPQAEESFSWQSLFRVLGWVLIPLLLIAIFITGWIWSLRKQVAVQVGRLAHELRERRKIEEDLRDKEEKFRTLAENLPGVVFMYDVLPDGSRIPVYSGPGLERLIGEELAQSIGYDVNEFFRLIPKRDQEHIEEESGRDPQSSVLTLEYRIRKQDSSYIWVRSISSSLPRPGGLWRVQGVLLDVSDKKRAEDALRESEEKFRMLVEGSSDGIFIKNERGEILDVNDAGCRMFGYRKEELLHLHFADLLPTELAQDLPEVFTEGDLSANQFVEYVSKRKDGSLFSTEIQMKFYHISGKKRLLVYVRDISERKQMENKLIQAQKMDSIGNLAGGIAHDFNNMLAGISGYISLLQHQESEPQKQAYLKSVMKAVENSSELTRKLLAFGRRGKNLSEAVNLNLVIQNVLDILQHSIDKRIGIECDFDSELHSIDADSSQMSQMVMNLCVNAVEAMQDGGVLTIKTQNQYLDDRFCHRYDQLNPGHYVVLTILDTGVGMDEMTRQRIFEPFFSTKQDSMVKGTGLGLSTVYGIVKNHGGVVEVTSQPEEGTEFKLFLPKGQKELHVESEKNMNEMPQGQASILVVDDEDLVREMVSDILETFGYQILEAEHGKKALEIYQEKYKQIDLVILDMKMPFMDGRETFREMRKINPNVVALLSTGFGNNNEAQEILDMGVKGLLSKPYKMDEIAQKVASLLHKG